MGWHREWDLVKIPLVLPKSMGEGPCPATGWEGTGVVDALCSLAAVGESYLPGPKITPPPRADPSEIPDDGDRIPPSPPSELPTFSTLSPVLQRIFPVKLVPTLREPAFPRPPPSMTRSQPRTWGHPIRLDDRLLRRTYHRLWESLVWVRPAVKEGKVGWIKCSYRDMRDWEEGKQVEVTVGREGEEKKSRKRMPGGAENYTKWSWASEDEKRWLSG